MLAGHGGTHLSSQHFAGLRWEDHLSPGVQGCCELCSSHYTPAWGTEQDFASKQILKRKNEGMRVCFSQFMGACRAGVGTGHPAVPGVEGQAHSPDSSPRPNSGRACPALWGGWPGPSPQLLTSRQRQLLRIRLPDPRPGCCCVEREAARSRAAAALPPQLPPARPCPLFSGPFYS